MEQYQKGYRQSNLAYNLNADPARKQEERTLREPKRQTRERPRISIGYLLCAFAVAAMLVLIVASYAELSELNIKAAQLEEEYVKLQEEYVIIEAAQERAQDLTSLAEYAKTRLGMVKAGNANIVYIDLGEEELIDLPSSAPSGGIRSVLHGFVGFLDTVVEFFR